MASHASDDEEADLLTFDMGGFISNKAKEQETRRRQQEEEAARRREEAAAAERRRQEKAEAERQRKEAATWDLLSPEEEAAMVQAVERAETAAEEAAMLQELERVEAAYAARAGAASTTGEAPAAAAVEQADGQKESAGQLPPKAPTASVSVKPDPEDRQRRPTTATAVKSEGPTRSAGRSSTSTATAGRVLVKDEDGSPAAAAAGTDSASNDGSDDPLDGSVRRSGRARRLSARAAAAAEAAAEKANGGGDDEEQEQEDEEEQAAASDVESVETQMPPEQQEEDEDAAAEVAMDVEEEEEEEEDQGPKRRGRRPSAAAGAKGKGKGKADAKAKIEAAKAKAAKAAAEEDDEEDDEDEPMEVEQEEEKEQKEGDVSGIFAPYRPKKLTIGKPHPGKIVETTVLARATPPDIWYKLHPRMTPAVESGKLSCAQLESIIYACQQHEKTVVNGDQVGGFFVGDGAGVGKGRTIAGLILENWHRGRKKAVWFSASTDLYQDAQRDLKDVGAGHIPHLALNEIKYDSKALDGFEGILFVTYSTSIGQSRGYGLEEGPTRVDQIVEWAGGGAFNGVLVFDEGHKAKKLVPEKEEGPGKARGKTKSTKTALCVDDIQQRLPKARVCYVSATGASSLENLGYMTRLGLWGRENGTFFDDQKTFMEDSGFKHSTGALELIAMGLKAQGKYLARTLSFADTSFRIQQVPLEGEFKAKYDTLAQVWYEVLEIMHEAATDLQSGAARYKGANQLPYMTQVTDHLKTFSGQYWGAHLRFFRHITVAAKVPYVVDLAKKAIEEGKCVVIGLISTGEAVAQRLVRHMKASNERAQRQGERASRRRRTGSVNYKELDGGDDSEGEGKENGGGGGKGGLLKPDPMEVDGGGEGGKDKAKAAAVGAKRKKAEDGDEEYEGEDDDEEEEEDFVGIESTLIELITKFVPDEGQGSLRKRDGQGRVLGEKEPFFYAQKKAELIAAVQDLELPQFPLDDLLEQLGGTDKVAEITGRKSRLERDEETGEMTEVNRAKALGCTHKRVNLEEMAHFQAGNKLVAIISEAGSTGISLHADRRAGNQRRRVHITLEIPFNSTNFVQQLGRSHRSNQVTGPEYLAVITDLPGEIRFAATAAKRLGQLGALTQGDRLACLGSSGLQEYDIDTKWGRKALEVLLDFMKDKHLDDTYMPARVREDPNPEAAKEAFKLSLTHNLSLFDLAVPFIKAINGGGRPTGGGRSKGAEGGMAISKFMNRILALKVDLQHDVFGFFEQIHHQLINEGKVNGQYDSGVSDIYAEKILDADSHELLQVEGVPVTFHEIKLDRGIPFARAREIEAQWLEDVKALQTEEQRAREQEAIRRQRQRARERMASHKRLMAMLKKAPKRTTRGAAKAAAATGGKGEEGAEKEDEMEEPEEEGPEQEAKEPEKEDDYDDGAGTGYYLRKDSPSHIVLALQIKDSAFGAGASVGTVRHRMTTKYKIVSPNTGYRGVAHFHYKDWIMTGSELLRLFQKIPPGELALQAAGEKWDKLYKKTRRMCLHEARGTSARWKTYDDGRTVRLNGDIDCWRNPNNRMGAKHKSKHSFCPVGRRTSIAYILSGAVIPIWPIIQHELDNSKYIQIVRCIVGKGAEQERVVGLEIKEGVQNNIVQAIHEFKTLHQLNDADDEALARRLQAEEEGQGDDEGEDEEGGGGKAKAASSASAAAAPSGKGGHKAAANISVGQMKTLDLYSFRRGVRTSASASASASATATAKPEPTLSAPKSAAQVKREKKVKVRRLRELRALVGTYGEEKGLLAYRRWHGEPDPEHARVLGLNLSTKAASAASASASTAGPSYTADGWKQDRLQKYIAELGAAQGLARYRLNYGEPIAEMARACGLDLSSAKGGGGEASSSSSSSSSSAAASSTGGGGGASGGAPAPSWKLGLLRQYVNLQGTEKGLAVNRKLHGEPDPSHARALGIDLSAKATAGSSAAASSGGGAGASAKAAASSGGGSSSGAPQAWKLDTLKLFIRLYGEEKGLARYRRDYGEPHPDHARKVGLDLSAKDGSTGSSKASSSASAASSALVSALNPLAKPFTPAAASISAASSSSSSSSSSAAAAAASSSASTSGGGGGGTAGGRRSPSIIKTLKGYMQSFTKRKA